MLRRGWIWLFGSALLLGGCPMPQMVPDDGMSTNGDTDGGSAPPVTVRDDDDTSGGSGTDDGNSTGGTDGSNTGGGSNDGSGSDGGNTGGGSNDGGSNDGNTDGGAGDGGNDGGMTDGGNTDGGTNDGGGGTDGGGTDGGGDGGDMQAARSGTFSGDVTWQITQGFSGTEFPFAPQTISLNLEFDADGDLTTVFVPGYSSATPDQTVNVLAPGQTTGLSEATIEFVSVAYTETTATISLTVTQNRTSGSLMEVGTGMQTISISISGDQLTFDSTMRYEVELQGSGPSIDTTETYTASATLTRQ